MPRVKSLKEKEEIYAVVYDWLIAKLINKAVYCGEVILRFLSFFFYLKKKPIGRGMIIF